MSPAFAIHPLFRIDSAPPEQGFPPDTGVCWGRRIERALEEISAPPCLPCPSHWRMREIALGLRPPPVPESPIWRCCPSAYAEYTPR